MNVRVFRSLAVVLSCFAACSSGKTTPATQLLVTIDSDIDVGTTLARVDAEVLDAQGKQIDKHTFKLTAGSASNGEVALPFSFGIDKHASQSLQLVVTGYGPDDGGDVTAIVQQSVNATFQTGKTIKLNVFLSVLCANTTCAADQTCYAASESGTAAGDCGPVPDADGGSNLVDAGSNDAVDAGGLTDAGGAGSAGHAGSAGARAGSSGGAAGGCTPSCASKQCGDDGCGKQCGTCQSTETCQSGTCSCVPDCTGKECGPDGCGGTCDPGCNAGVGECVDGACELTCDATSTACSCDTPPSDAALGNLYADSKCASGLAVFRACMNNGVPLTCGGSGLQWGETCYCPTN